MGKTFYYIIICTAFLGFISCSDETSVESGTSPEEPTVKPPIDFGDMENGDKIPIYYSENGGKTYIAEYKAVRIGEYLWMDCNFTIKKNTWNKATKHQINKGLNIYEIDTTKYSISVADLEKYFGQYYSRAELEQMVTAGNMFEGKDKINSGKWSLPTTAAFRQLFAMCGDASEPAVRTTLCYKVGQIPIAKKAKNVFWVQDANTNKYGFNLVYSGGRCHSNNFPWWICYGVNDCVSFSGNQGDLYTFYAAVMYPTLDAKTAKIHDYPDTREGKIWAWLPMRWCRKLTDKELGYKLYVNKDRTDILKLGLGENPPSGYEVLKDGYLRGFYVQFMLDNPKSTYTVSMLRQMEKQLPEVRYGTPLT